jgi:hypothetical protein
VTSSGVVESGSTFRALDVSVKPLEYHTLGGAYRKSLLSGTMAAALAANSEIAHFRWASATKFAVIRLIQLDGMNVATGFTAGVGLISLTIAQNWTADGSGGTTATMTANNGKMRTNMAPSELATTSGGALRCATTAALTAGTKSVLADYMSEAQVQLPATANIQALPTYVLLGDDTARGAQPLVLAQNEGWLVRAAVPITGTWNFGITTAWTEVVSY